MTGSTRLGARERPATDRAEARRDGAPSAPRALSAAGVLGLQRRAGNKAVGALLARKSVEVELRTPPPWTKPPPAVDRTTPENRMLAQEIDALDARKLSDAELIKLRTDVTLKLPSRGVTTTQQAEHEKLLRTLQAVEYVISQRRKEARHYGASERERELGPVVPDWTRWRYVRRDPAMRRAWVRWLIEQRVRETKSFKQAMKLIRYTGTLGADLSEIRDELDAVEEEARRFGGEFEGQARQNAKRVLSGSLKVIDDVLTDYGIPVRLAHGIAGDLFKSQEGVKGYHLTTEAAAKIVVERAKETAPSAYIAGRAKREKLTQSVGRIRALQDKVAAAKKRMWTGAQEHKGHEAEDKAAFVAAKGELAAAWFEEERAQPVLASYRRGREREKRDLDDSPFSSIDLAALDTDSADQKMTAVLVRVLPTLAHLGRANTLIENGMSPLRLPAVVALTSSNMLIPEGSIRAGVVNDLVERERDDRESWMVMAASLALSLVTLLPTGGASLAMVNLAAGALAAYTSLQELENYETQTVLADTDLDKARSLSLEEPSLWGFAMSLVGLGFEAWAQYHAFSKARELRGLMKRGQDGSLIVRDLNDFGRRRGVPDLGKRARAEIEAAERAAKPPAAPPKKPPAVEPPDAKSAPKKKPPAHYEPEDAKSAPKKSKPKPVVEKSDPSGPTPVSDKPKGKPQKEAAEKSAEKPPPAPKKKPPTPPPLPDSVQVLKTFKDRADVFRQVKAAIAHLWSGMTRSRLPSEYDRILLALKANPGLVNDEIRDLLPVVMGALRDPDLYAEVIADAWQLATTKGTDINGALRMMARRSGVIEEIPAGPLLRNKDFFERYATKKAYLVDRAAAGDHGVHTHLLQDLVVDRALAKRGLSSPEFRAKLRQAEGIVRESREFITTDFLTFVRTDHGFMQTGDYVWRLTYDLFANSAQHKVHLNQPEVLKPLLDKVLLMM
jgi:hypothetical protein